MPRHPLRAQERHPLANAADGARIRVGRDLLASVRGVAAARVWRKLHQPMLERLAAAGWIDWTRAALDSRSLPANKGEPPSARIRPIPPLSRRLRAAAHQALHRAEGRQLRESARTAPVDRGARAGVAGSIPAPDDPLRMPRRHAPRLPAPRLCPHLLELPPAVVKRSVSGSPRSGSRRHRRPIGDHRSPAAAPVTAR